MSLTATTARNRVKDLADIASTDTSFDADIDNYVTSAVNNLYPMAMAEVAPDITKTFAADGRNVTLPSGIDQIRRLELYDSTISDYVPEPDFIVHGTEIWLDEAVSASTVARIWGWARYALTTVPAELELVVIYWATSYLYDSLAGNKRKYNTFIASTGAAGDRDMKDSADFYLQKGNQMLVDRAKLAGG